VTLQQAPPAFTLPAALLLQGFALRPETGADIPFLLELYASTRAAELAPVPWSAEQKQAFLASQFQAQRTHYRTYFPDCAFDVIEQRGAPAGRLYLDVRRSQLHIIDIALLPDWRGRGIGTAILEALQAAARAAGKGVGIMVEKFNPALQLYRRLGFTNIADHEVYLEMEWRPDGPDCSAVAKRPDDKGAMQRFAAVVMADPALAARLAAIEDGVAFIEQATRSAKAHGIVLPEADLLNAAQPDLLGLARWSQAPLTGSRLPPRDWLPIGITADSGAIDVDWARFGAEPLRAFFYEEAVRRALRLPFNRAFRYRTGLQDLVAQADGTESLQPNGFIFHMSRCGSTLAAQMLAALADSIVISEAAPLDAVVQHARSLSGDDAVQALRAIVAAFGRKRSGRERRYVIKLDCWHTLALPLFRRAFPEVPWVFLYRDPVEVLVSQMRERGMQTVPQFLPPGFYGIAADESMTQEDYCARVLGAICRAITDHRDVGGGLILNYRQLPDAVWTALLPHFGMSCGEKERQSMRQAARQNAKSPGLPFAGDTEAKQRAATDTIRRAADRHLGETYNRLETLSAHRHCERSEAIQT